GAGGRGGSPTQGLRRVRGHRGPDGARRRSGDLLALPSGTSRRGGQRRGAGVAAQPDLEAGREPDARRSRPARLAAGAVNVSTSTTARRLGKRQRQHLVALLVEGHAVHNQGELVELLAVHGVSATQSTVSRDLEELGAIKIRVPGGHTAYAIPELPAHQVAPLDQLRRACADWVVDVDVSMNLVVVRTPPGSAHVVAAALDRANLA